MKQLDTQALMFTDLFLSYSCEAYFLALNVL